MPRSPATAVGAAALALTAVAVSRCVSTSMSAAEVRVPVLLGPVPCLGCTADARVRPTLPATQVAGEARAFGVFIPIGNGVGWGEANDVGISADRLLFGTPCGADIRLSNVQAHAWQLTVPLLFYLYDVSVKADAATVLVPGGSCPAR